MLLEIFAEKRLVREIQRFGHLQDRQSGRFQQGLGFENHIIVDPRAGRFSGKSLNHVRQMLWRQTKFVGIKGHTTLGFIMIPDQMNELFEHFVPTRFHLPSDGGSMTVHDIAQFVKKSMEQACADMGLTMSAAFTVFAKKVGRERRIPFEITADPFYSESNMAHLRRGVAALNAGKGVEHEPIEVDGE